MSSSMNDPCVMLDGGPDPHVGVIVVDDLEVAATQPQAESVHGCRRVAGEEEAVDEAAETGRRWLADEEACADVEAGRRRLEVAPPPRQHAGAHHLPRL